uniref:Hepatocyte growth factor-regulated tyrosine kinase substrate n=1 Tax=Clastoptera arizonana TaxID=38151 RepID=A0A1B6CX77_9HEMI
MFRSSNFDKLLDKATSNLKLEPDWPAILQITDLIRQGDVQPKYALAGIKKKLYSPNPHVAMFGLLVLESCVKNCGGLIHDEIGTKAYMEQLRDLVKTTPHDNVQAKVLELIQAWAFAFRNSPKYRAVQDTMNIMKAEDYKFPVLKESDAMFSADTAPEWADGDCCHRCRVQFGMVQRKHHCRACGQVFCSQCSSRTCTLPKFGIEKEVRVCEACYNKLSKPTAVSKTTTEDLPVEYLTSSLAQQNQAPPPRKTEEELQEEEELQLALALSQSEAEHKHKNYTPGVASVLPKTYSPPFTARDSSTPTEDVDPELARYLNRSYWENKQPEQDSSPSAPAPLSQNMTKQIEEVDQNGVSDGQMEDFIKALKSQVEIFVNRMKSNSSRGRSIANDTSVQTLFMNITAMHSRLLRYIQQQDDSRVHYEGLQDKLVQVKDARAALDALREEHRERLRREAEIAERQRQMQMAQKLDIMRKKKQEYLQYQNQLALQRIQEQAREMQMRQEQQKQQYLMGSYNQIHFLPQGSNPVGMVGAGGGVFPAPGSGGFPHYPANGVPPVVMMMPPPSSGYMPAPVQTQGGHVVPPSMIQRPGLPPQMMPPNYPMMGIPRPGMMQGPGPVQVQLQQGPHHHQAGMPLQGAPPNQSQPIGQLPQNPVGHQQNPGQSQMGLQITPQGHMAPPQMSNPGNINQPHGAPIMMGPSLPQSYQPPPQAQPSQQAQPPSEEQTAELIKFD